MRPFRNKYRLQVFDSYSEEAKTASTLSSLLPVSFAFEMELVVQRKSSLNKQLVKASLPQSVSFIKILPAHMVDHSL